MGDELKNGKSLLENSDYKKKKKKEKKKRGNIFRG